MAISVNWATRVVTIPRADMPLVQASPEVRELDVDDLRLWLRAAEASEAGIAHPGPVANTEPKAVGSATLARVVELQNGYTITFEDGLYAVNVVGGNSNLEPVGGLVNRNQVGYATANSAGVVQVASGSGLSAEQDALLTQVGARVDVVVSTRAEPGQGLSAGQAGALAGVAANADVATSSRAAPGEGLTSDQGTWLERIATLLGVPGMPAQVLASSGTTGAGGVLTTTRRVAGVLWGTIVTAGAGTETEEATVTPEVLP